MDWLDEQKKKWLSYQSNLHIKCNLYQNSNSNIGILNSNNNKKTKDKTNKIY